MKIYDRNNHEIIVDQSQNELLKKLYSHVLGRCALKVLTLPFITYLGGVYMNSCLSKHRIAPFIKQNHIDMDQYITQTYKSYNDFFTRKIKKEKRPICQDKNILIAPADSKLSYYHIDENLKLQIKNTIYSLEDLLQNKTLADDYHDGICLVFRLTVDDYHRYCFIDDGVKGEDCFIKGIFHTVNPIANDYYPIYKQNSRMYTVLHTENFGDVVHMEVGAMMVGKIMNHHVNSFQRGQEKGYFEFGGSTIVLLLKKDVVKIDEDIMKHSSTYDETRVLLGEKIGVKI